MKRPLLLGAAAAVVLIVAVYLFSSRTTSVSPGTVVLGPVAVIGSGSDAVGVAADGEVLSELQLPEEPGLPELSLQKPPEDGRVKGPALEQVKVLAAAPPVLFPYVEGSYFGESGVDVNLASGFELRFGSSIQAARKWRAAAAVLADPSVTAFDYVDLHAPGHPTVDGSGHTLPPPP